MKIAILAVQGAFIEHEQMLRALGAETVELRKKEDLAGGFDGLVLPGGESTVQGKLLRELGMFDFLKERLEAGLPALATCAGLILLAEHIENDENRYFATLPVTVRRNAYGRQLGSFRQEAALAGGLAQAGTFPMEFIRAPQITALGENVETLASVNGQAAAVRYGNQIAAAFHPELSGNGAIHRYFLDIVRQNSLPD